MSSLLSMPLAAPQEGHFTPPEPADFWAPIWGHGAFAFTRPMFIMLCSFIILVLWLTLSLRKASVVPGKAQWLVEQVYHFVREDIGRGMIGSRDFLKFMPLMFALFIWILMNNLMGVIPFFQLPPMARIGFPIGLVAIVYVTYHVVGIAKHGIGGYLGALVPPGVPIFLAPVIFLLELVTVFITRPLTLALRLFGNMFAGHMLLVLFIVGGEFLLFEGSGLIKLAGAASYVMAALMTVFEMLIEFVQAYVFTLLAASYIGGALADEH